MHDSAIRGDVGDSPMFDPIAFFLTWVTYGTWLPGDHRGWPEYRRGWKLPQPFLELECRARQEENSCILGPNDQQLVEDQIAETCTYRGWKLHAVNCRTNHVHVVVAAHDTKPKKIRTDLKAYASRRLSKSSLQSDRTNWWAERGSIRWVWNDDSLARVVTYTLESQDQNGNTISEPET